MHSPRVVRQEGGTGDPVVDATLVVVCPWQTQDARSIGNRISTDRLGKATHDSRSVIERYALTKEPVGVPAVARVNEDRGRQVGSTKGEQSSGLVAVEVLGIHVGP